MSAILHMDNNFLSLDDVESRRNLVTSTNFPWYMNLEGVDMDKNDAYEFSNESKPQLVFGHVLIRNSVANSNMINEFVPIFDKFCAKNNISYRTIFRAQVNLMLRKNEAIPTPPHIDMHGINHNVFLYYFNDSDGDTIIYNQKQGQDFDGFTVMETVSPKAGLGVVFNGNFYHSGSAPIHHEYRALLNLVYEPIDK